MLHLAPTPTTDTRPDPAVPSTTVLVEAARAHDRAAWAELFDRYEVLVRRTVAGYRLRDADADDAVQNTWLRAFEHLDAVDDPERLGGWLRTTARRECIKVVRQLRREGPADVDLEALADAGKGPEAAALSGESRAVVAAAVGRLPERRRMIIRALFYRPEAGYAQLAEEMDLPVGSIGPTRRRALCTLRSELGRSGFLCDRAPA
jgi:RNA polymerase sigma factor (sigma-70 family)